LLLALRGHLVTFAIRLPANSIISYGGANAWGDCSIEARLGILRYKLLELLEACSYMARLFRRYQGRLDKPKLLLPMA
jgi:hypothetical protein